MQGFISILKNFVRKETFLPPPSSFKNGYLLHVAAWALFMFTVFSGVFRKWVLGPGALSNAIFFVQLLFPVIFFLLVVRTKIYTQVKTPALLIIFFFYMVLAALNPKNHTMYHGFFGLVIHSGFWLAWLAYYKRRHFFELEKFINFFLIILIAEVILASIQYNLPGTHILNRFSTGDENTASVGQAIRVTGTFSFLGGFQAMVTFFSFLIWFMLVQRFPSSMIIIVFALSMLAGFFSGSRSSVALVFIISIFSFFYTGFAIKKFGNFVASLLVLGLMVFYLGGNLINTFEQAYLNFLSRVEWGLDSGETSGRLDWIYNEVLQFKGKYPIYGIGLGSTYQGANILFGESIFAKEYGYYESELGRIVLEGGFILLFLRIILFFTLIRYSYIPFLGKVMMFLFFINNMIIFNTYQGVFFLFGLILVDRAYYLQYTPQFPPVKPS